MNLNFNANKTPIEIIEEEGTYFRDIFSGINGKWYRKSQRELHELKHVNKKYYYSNYFNIRINKLKVNVETPQDFGKLKAWIDCTDQFYRSLCFFLRIAFQILVRQKIFRR